uniref:Uncharacterized protein n=1 Tax=Paulinella chromatophora TaxID=39717 RepID=B1X4F1_PAUCH|nr:hypothetical protein PCC_0379 [Paulinella chromatophora]ACB42820.1 hypothetical protein PCC_0379 [Paulinella chromatophora]
MSIDFNDSSLELVDLIETYQSWVLAVASNIAAEDVNTTAYLDEELRGDALDCMRYLPDELTSAVETTVAMSFNIAIEDLLALLFPDEEI